MSLGVSILFQRPQPGSPSLFGFLKPLSLFIWILVLASYVAVAVLMSCIARLVIHLQPPNRAQHALKIVNDVF